MFTIILKLLLSVLLTFMVIFMLIGILYYFCLITSIITGLWGWYGISNWFRNRVDGLTARISKVYSIIVRK